LLEFHPALLYASSVAVVYAQREEKRIQVRNHPADTAPKEIALSATESREAPGPLLIRLFGPFEVHLAGQPLLRLRSRKGHLILALLLLRRGSPIERAWLAGTLWPDSGTCRALSYLRYSLRDLRSALGSQAWRLHAPSLKTLALDLSDAWVDVVAFDAAVSRGDAAALEELLSLYRGPLLEGCVEEWIFQERSHREQACLRALESLAEGALGRGDPATAECHLRRAVALDPLRESAQRALMQLLAGSGNYAAAMQVYRELRERLHRELNALPDPQTTALYQHLRAEARSKAMTSNTASEGPVGAGRIGRVAANTPTFSSPLRSLEAFAHNLPLQLTSFIGREGEIASVKCLLQSTRLLTLTGAGGCGKTRLALQVAAELLVGAGPRACPLPDGAWLVELAALSDPPLVPQTVAAALGVREEPDRPLLATLTDSLQPRTLLLVLDNCEHLLSACAQLVEALLRRCPNVQVLATSREGLGIAGEQSYRVPPLSVPDPHCLPSDPESLTRYDAVHLFLDRARLSQPTFTITRHNASAVAQLCHRLDGIPLAIELAAARVKMLPVEKMNERLDDVFRILKGGSRTALPRHRTLRALIDWSYDLLSEPERRLLRGLSVFAGGWTLEAAEAVCTGDGTDELEVLDLLTALLEKSLVLHDEREGGARYRLLETVRQYARERLMEREEAEPLRRQHAGYFLALAEAAEPHLLGPEQGTWFDRLETELDNVRAALRWSVERGESETGLRLASALLEFWPKRGALTEVAERLGQLLALVEQPVAPAIRARALFTAANLAWMQSNYPASHSYFEESARICRELGDERRLAESLANLATTVLERGDAVTARALSEESVAVARGLGDPWVLSWSLFRLAQAVAAQGDPRAAQSLYEESMATAEQIPDPHTIAQCLDGLGNLARSRQDLGVARRHCEAAVAIVQELRDRFCQSRFVYSLGRVALKEGAIDEARSHWQEGLRLSWEEGQRWGIAQCLEGLAAVAAAQGEFDRSARFYGRAEALRRAIDAPLPPSERAEHDRRVAAARAQGGEAAFAAAWAAGRALTLERIVAEALGRC
jgi:non-specific serine/threonine protein kinase